MYFKVAHSPIYIIVHCGIVPCSLCFLSFRERPISACLRNFCNHVTSNLPKWHNSKRGRLDWLSLMHITATQSHTVNANVIWKINSSPAASYEPWSCFVSSCLMLLGAVGRRTHIKEECHAFGVKKQANAAQGSCTQTVSEVLLTALCSNNVTRTASSSE